ncbi:MAG TPA: PQQ-binding-like beta-propeller repeat protein [Thermoanaerobaculia bacterium]|nr:PQQ-binding-like beta-propeller repeat protein [Thermoanaerobaculia bacterium]
MFTTPTVVGDVVFVGSCSGVIYGIDKHSGEVRWTYDTRQHAGPAQFHGDPAVVGDLVFTGSDTAEPSFFYALRAATGEVVWKSDVDVIESDVQVAAGLAIGQTYAGDFVALDLESGERRWRLAADERRCGRRPKAPAVAGDTVFLGAPDGTVKAVRAADAEVLWSRDEGCLSTTPVLWRDTLWAGTADGTVRALDPGTGALRGTVDVGGLPHGRLVPVAESVLVVQVGEREVVGIDPDGPRSKWRYRADNELSSPRPHEHSGLALVGDAEGRVIALDPRDGSEVWTVEVSGTVRGVGSEPGALYVGTLGGVVYKVTPPASP